MKKYYSNELGNKAIINANEVYTSNLIKLVTKIISFLWFNSNLVISCSYN